MMGELMTAGGELVVLGATISCSTSLPSLAAGSALLSPAPTTTTAVVSAGAGSGVGVGWTSMMAGGGVVWTGAGVFTSGDATATLGIAVHLLPSIDVKNAPAGRLFDAILFSLFFLNPYTHSLEILFGSARPVAIEGKV